MKHLINGLCIVIFSLIGLDVSYGQLVSNGGFEDPGTINVGAIPEIFGSWNGDETEVVSFQNGITPFEGIQMLQFEFSDHTGGSGNSASDIYQIIDISDHASTISAGIAEANLSAWFNRVAGDIQTDTSFAVSLTAYTGTPASFPTQFRNQTYLSITTQGLLSDGDVSTWENATLSMAIPSNTDFLGIRIFAHENIFNDSSGIEFDGHYVDNVSLTIIPEPASILLIALGGFIRYRKHRPLI